MRCVCDHLFAMKHLSQTACTQHSSKPTSRFFWTALTPSTTTAMPAAASAPFCARINQKAWSNIYGTLIRHCSMSCDL